MWHFTTLSLAVDWNVCCQKLFISSLSMILNPLTPVPAVTNPGLSPTSDTITFDQNWHHQFSTSAGGKDLPVIPRSECSAYKWRLRYVQKCSYYKLSGRLRATFSATACGHMHGKIAHRDGTFLEFFQLEASPLKGQSLMQKEKKMGKRKGKEKFKSQKPLWHSWLSQNFDFYTCLSQNVLKCDASEKKGMLSCCRCFFE